jgi:hypothetical protein
MFLFYRNSRRSRKWIFGLGLLTNRKSAGSLLEPFGPVGPFGLGEEQEQQDPIFGIIMR